MYVVNLAGSLALNHNGIRALYETGSLRRSNGRCLCVFSGCDGDFCVWTIFVSFKFFFYYWFRDSCVCERVCFCMCLSYFLKSFERRTCSIFWQAKAREETKNKNSTFQVIVGRGIFFVILTMCVCVCVCTYSSVACVRYEWMEVSRFRFTLCTKRALYDDHKH